MFSKEKKLWKWFAGHLGEFQSMDSENLLFNEFHQKLTKIHPSLVYEIGPGKSEESRTLVISCDGIRAGIPFVEKIVESAPEMDGWEVVGFRQPINESINLEMDDIKLSTDDILFDYNAAADDMVDLVLFINKEVNVDNKDSYSRAALVLLDFAVGEYFVMTRVRNLDLQPISPEKKDLYHLAEIKDVLVD